eukprot:scaffold9369_cov182-Amphora_coffeaeformis.AAC.5
MMDCSTRAGTCSSSSSSSSSHGLYPWWNMFRSIWRLRIVGFLDMIACFYWLQYYHFRFGMPSVSGEQNKRVIGVPDMKANTKDAAAAVNPVSTSSTMRTPCPFQSPKVTGFKNWTLYPKESFDGLRLLRPKKESVLMTAFPGCVPFVLPKQKLLLFTVLKVSSTVFTQVAKRLDGIPDWANGCGNVQNPMTTNLTYLTDVPPKYAEQLLLDPDWTKAIFVRDPKERVLSAYLNKAVGETSYMKTRCCSQTSEDVHALLECSNRKSLPIISFHDFLTVVVPQCKDGHWCRQSDLMRPEQWEHVNFVGHFDRLEEDAHRLLDHLGVWDEMGASGWPHGSLYAGSSTVNHQTGAHDRLSEYYTPELDDFADNFYEADYNSPYLGLPKYRLFGA